MLLDDLTQDLNKALKAGEKTRVDTLRFLISAVKKFEIDAYPPGKGNITDAEVLNVIRKQVKQHQESIAAFTKGNRPELAQKEEEELGILRHYLPAELSDEQIRIIVEKYHEKGLTNFGELMGEVMKEIAGQASGDRVRTAVQKYLNQEGFL